MSNLGNRATMSRNLKYYMGLNNKTRQDVCSDLGFAYSTFCEWANGRKYPRIDKIEMLAEYFGIEKSDLIEDKKHTDIGSFITELRQAKNKTLLEMASELNIPVDDLSAYETGAKSVPDQVMILIAKYFNINVMQLQSGDRGLIAFVTENEDIVKRYRRWQDAIGYQVNFTNEEIDKLISYAKFLLSQREK